MKAIILNDFGDPDNLVLTDVEQPTIGDDEVLIQVKAISINPVDIKTRKGSALASKLKEDSPVILGWDVSGIVTDVGKQVTTFQTGDEVFGMVNFPGHGKAYAEYVAAPAAHLAKKPSSLPFDQAAAGTLAALTAWQAFNQYTSIHSGDTVLIHAAAGGVGHFAVQIAKQLGAYVVGTSSAKNKDFILSLGADEHIDYQAQPFERAVDGVDLVLDAIGGDYIDRSLKTIKPGGKIISIVSGMNEKVAEKAKATGIEGLQILVQSNGEHMNELAEWFDKGLLRSHVSQTFSFDQMGAAHRQIETGRTVGKVVITL